MNIPNANNYNQSRRQTGHTATELAEDGTLNGYHLILTWLFGLLLGYWLSR